MAYIDGLLADGESVLISARRHALFVAARLVLLGVAAVALAALGVWVATSVSTLAAIVPWAVAAVAAGLAVARFLAWRSEQFVVTNYRIIQTEGVLNKRVLDSSLEKVNDILMTQSLIGRMLDYGTIEIITGSDVGVNRLDALAHPALFKRMIVDARNRLAGEGPGDE
ncbi:MAG: PH domain-containing protein, partial [Thermomicrobiaceae bacterium]|nr:PH domain-containing protein [Thermomicrobiaceae bacterium]